MTRLPEKNWAGAAKTLVAGKYLHACEVEPKLIGKINDNNFKPPTPINSQRKIGDINKQELIHFNVIGPIV